MLCWSVRGGAGLLLTAALFQATLTFRKALRKRIAPYDDVRHILVFIFTLNNTQCYLKLLYMIYCIS